MIIVRLKSFFDDDTTLNQRKIIINSAIDTIEALRAENAKLQAALQARGGQVLERNALILDIYNAWDHYLRSGKSIEVEQ